MFQTVFTEDRIGRLGPSLLVIMLWAAILLPGVFSHAQTQRQAPAQKAAVTVNGTAHSQGVNTTSIKPSGKHDGELISGVW